jgi:hypothetical protein
VKLPRCRCGRKAIAFTPGDAPARAPGGVLIERGQPVRGWCLACALRHGLLQRPKAAAAANPPAKLTAPRGASRAPATGKAKGRQ